MKRITLRIQEVTGNISLIFKQNIFLLLKPTQLEQSYIGTIILTFQISMSQQLFVLMRIKEDLETSNQNVKDVNREQDECNEKELEPMVSILAAKVVEKMNHLSFKDMLQCLLFNSFI